jgi:hypothetical protein
MNSDVEEEGQHDAHPPTISGIGFDPGETPRAPEDQTPAG